MSTIEDLKKLHAQFENDEGSIGFLELCDLMDGLKKLLAVFGAAKTARKSKVLRRSGYYDVSQFDEVFAEFDKLAAELGEPAQDEEGVEHGWTPKRHAVRKALKKFLKDES